MIQHYVVLLFASRLEWDAPYSAYLLTTLYFLTIFIFSSQNFNKNVLSKFTNDHHIDKYNRFSFRLLGSILLFSPVTCMSQSRYSRTTSNLWLKFYLIISKICSFSYTSDFITWTSLNSDLKHRIHLFPMSQPHFTYLIDFQVY